MSPRVNVIGELENIGLEWTENVHEEDDLVVRLDGEYGSHHIDGTEDTAEKLEWAAEKVREELAEEQ